MVPIEIGKPSIRVQTHDEHTNAEHIREELDLLEEVRDMAAMRNGAYQQRMAKYYNSKVKPRRLQPGDLVLRKAEFVAQPKWKKLSPNWEGPYIVKKEVFPGTYQLMYENGNSVPRTWNLEHLKKFYQ